MLGTKLMAGEKAPDFNLKDQDKKAHTLADYLGKWVVLYFYPKDQTPGCIIEAQGFRDHEYEISDLDAVVLGVSPDDAKSHKAFSEHESLNFPLLSDTGGETSRAYGVWKEKTMFGKKFWGIARTTFLIDPKGVIRMVCRNVKPLGHAEKILVDLKELQSP